MPNIKSAKKRVLVNTKKTEQNKSIRSKLKTTIKNIEILVKENKIDEAKAMLPKAFATIDSACTKKIIHKNCASNKKARLAKLVDSMATATQEVVETAPVVEEVKEEVVEVKKPARKPRAKKTETVAE